MADETVTNGDFADALNVEIDGDETSKISSLTKKVAEFEQANDEVIKENEGYKRRVEELKASVEELTNLNEELKNLVKKAESENKTLGAVAARAAELEVEVLRLQHDMADNGEVSAELSGLKTDLEGAKEREKEKDFELTAALKERDLLVAKVEKLEGGEIDLRVELEGKEKEIRGLKKNVEDLESELASSKKLKVELEKAAEKMKVEISVLGSSLDEKEKLISGFDTKARTLVNIENGGVGGDIAGEGRKKGLNGEWKQDYLLVCGSTIAAFAVVGVACYVHVKKH